MIGYEETEVLDVRPAEYFVRVIKREKRACKQCAEQGVRTAGAPERIAPKSLLSDHFIIDLVVGKYCESLPIYRQQVMLSRDGGVEIALSTLNDAVMCVGELLIPMVGVMKRDLLAGHYIQADETPVGVQTHEKSGSNHQAYFWQYGSPGKGVVFDFRMGRDRDGPSSSWANSKACCKQTVTRHTPRLAARRSPTPAVWRMRDGSSSMRVKLNKNDTASALHRRPDGRTVRYRSRGQGEKHGPGATRCAAARPGSRPA